MKITKEDAKRLINELPKYYGETANIKAIALGGKVKKVNELVIKDVVLGIVEVNNRLTPVFLDPDDKRIRVVLMSMEETKQGIEFWYRYVKTRQKSIAILSIYTDLNNILEEREKVNVQKTIENVKLLNKNFTKLALDFEPINVEHLPTDVYKRMKDKVEEATVNKYSLGFEDIDNGLEAYLIANDPKSNFILETIYQEDVAKLLKIISLSDTYIKDFTRVIYHNNNQYTYDFVKSTTPSTANIFSQALDLSLATLETIRKKYENDVLTVNNVILSIRKLYDEPEHYEF